MFVPPFRYWFPSFPGENEGNSRYVHTLMIEESNIHPDQPKIEKANRKIF